MRHRTSLMLSACCLAVAGCAVQPSVAQPVTEPVTQPATEPVTEAGPLPGRFYGVTIDEVTNLSQIVTSLRHLPRRPVARIAFDPGIGPADYRQAVDAISKVAYIMAEPVDSSEVTGYTPAQYTARFRDYMAAFRTKVSLWEIGNEVNGSWLGPARRVVRDIQGAYKVVTRAGGRTALTLAYEPGCAGGASHDMWTWAVRNIPAAMKQGLDYVLISYYEEDCGNYRPTQAQWDGVVPYQRSPLWRGLASTVLITDMR
jgi:hypothetical protein